MKLVADITHWFEQEQRASWDRRVLVGGFWFLVLLGFMFMLWMAWPEVDGLENE